MSICICGFASSVCVCVRVCVWSMGEKSIKWRRLNARISLLACHQFRSLLRLRNNSIRTVHSHFAPIDRHLSKILEASESLPADSKSIQTELHLHFAPTNHIQLSTGGELAGMLKHAAPPFDLIRRGSIPTSLRRPRLSNSLLFYMLEYR